MWSGWIDSCAYWGTPADCVAKMGGFDTKDNQMSRDRDPRDETGWPFVVFIVSIIVALVFASGQSWFAALLSLVIGAGVLIKSLLSGLDKNSPL